MFHSLVIQRLIFFFKFPKFGRCAHDESLIDNEPLYRSRLMYISVVSDPEQLIIFFKLLNFGRCAHDGSSIGNESPYR